MTMNKKNRIKVNRTSEGNIFEMITVVILVVMWIVISLIIMKDRADDVRELVLNGAGGTIAAVLCLIAAYFPDRMINMPFRIRNIRQYYIMARMTRTLAFEITLMSTTIALMQGGCAGGTGLYAAAIAILLATVLIFTIVIHKAGR